MLYLLMTMTGLGDCLLKTLARTTNLAYSLDGYLWAISALAVENYKSDVSWIHIS